MADVTHTVRTFDLQRFPAAERIAVVYVPSTGAHTNVSVFPERAVVVLPDDAGFVKVDLVTTLELRPEMWFTVVYEYYSSAHPITGDRTMIGAYALPGKLRVPPQGGDQGELMDTPPPPGTIVSGFGPPPLWLQDVIYVDNSGMVAKLWLPEGTVGTS